MITIDKISSYDYKINIHKDKFSINLLAKIDCYDPEIVEMFLLPDSYNGVYDILSQALCDFLIKPYMDQVEIDLASVFYSDIEDERIELLSEARWV